MRSVVDSLSAADRAELRAMTATQRVALALALGRRDLESFRLAQHPPLEPEAAARRLERQRQASRRRSASIEAMLRE